MNGWVEVSLTVNSAFSGSDQRSRSIKRSLSRIINRAIEWEIDPFFASQASKSNLVEIIRDAKSAIRDENRELLVELFNCAGTLTNKNLRIRLRPPHRQRIHISEIRRRRTTRYRVELTAEQLSIISRKTDPLYVFSMNGRPIQLHINWRKNQEIGQAGGLR